LLLSLVSIAFLGSLAHACEMTITIKKAGESKAKIEPMPNGKDKSAVVHIRFNSGADWSTVKDSYTVSCGTSCALMAGKESISIGSDGTATFHSRKIAKCRAKK
jgi:hypothetical protein